MIIKSFCLYCILIILFFKYVCFSNRLRGDSCECAFARTDALVHHRKYCRSNSRMAKLNEEKEESIDVHCSNTHYSEILMYVIHVVNC